MVQQKKKQIMRLYSRRDKIVFSDSYTIFSKGDYIVYRRTVYKIRGEKSSYFFYILYFNTLKP